MRNTRTAAGFEPCHPKRTSKNCLTSPLESIRKQICPQLRNTRTAAGFEHITSLSSQIARSLVAPTSSRQQYSINQTPRRAPPLARGRRIIDCFPTLPMLVSDRVHHFSWPCDVLAKPSVHFWAVCAAGCSDT